MNDTTTTTTPTQTTTAPICPIVARELARLVSGCCGAVETEDMPDYLGICPECGGRTTFMAEAVYLAGGNS
jgi:hypothetical protein